MPHSLQACGKINDFKLSAALIDSFNMSMNIATMKDSRNWFKTFSETRQRKLLASQRDGLNITVEGKVLRNFASNDYLGMSVHPQVCAAAKDVINQQGLGSGASRLVSGDAPLLHQFERELADWKGFEACLIVGSGMLANIGLLQALANRHTDIFSDKLNHASLVDGARLSGAKVSRYAHLDMGKLEQLLQKSVAKQRIIVSDGVFSMDGDAADVASLISLAEVYDALIVIDDAHGTGTLGEQGEGLISEFAGHARLIEVGTLGKALGSYGAYILGTLEMIEGLKQRMRTLIYSTALPLSVIAAAQAALSLIQTTDVVKTLQSNVLYFLHQAQNFSLMPSSTAIQLVLLGSDEKALSAAISLREYGFFVPAIRPPTVPQGQSRLRITLAATHSQQDINSLIKALSNLG
ncbi:MAG: 8-amino-7-oxononanoate synthase [Ghiorsea sp.]|nr:8-amino-7-oxononanoate synthase [Ghiorsea sp.]